jgi:flagellar basal-body rod protein FlgB
MSLLDTTQFALESAMRGSMLRQTLLSGNLANVDTPGYQPEDVDFQSTLQSAIEAGQSGSQLQDVNFSPVTQSQQVAADGNGVSSEQVSADMADNGLLYENLTGVAAQREQILITAIGQQQ